MILPDVNVLIYAFRTDSEDHERYKDWLESVVNGPTVYGIGFVREFKSLVHNAGRGGKKEDRVHKIYNRYDHAAALRPSRWGQRA